MRDIGKVEEFHFHFYKGKTFSIDVVWWHDPARTVPAVITSARGRIKQGSTFISLNPTFNGNTVTVRLSQEETAAISGLASGYLEVEASTVNETKVLLRGPVTFYAETSE